MKCGEGDIIGLFSFNYTDIWQFQYDWVNCVNLKDQWTYFTKKLLGRNNFPNFLYNKVLGKLYIQ